MPHALGDRLSDTAMPAGLPTPTVTASDAHSTP